MTVDNRFTESFVGAEDQLIGAVRFAARKLLGVEGDGKGQLAVSASEAMAKVLLDDKPAGMLPCPPIADLPPGQHSVRLAKDGFLDWRSDIYIDPGGTTPLWVVLQEEPARWYETWWFWTGVGVVVAGAAITGMALALRPGGDIPDSSDGKITIRGANP